MRDPKDSFESWLLRRVAHGVEGGEVSADLLVELHAELEAARAQPREEGHGLAVYAFAERWGVPVEHVENMLAAFEAQPTVTRQWLLRRIAEAWLASRRR